MNVKGELSGNYVLSSIEKSSSIKTKSKSFISEEYKNMISKLSNFPFKLESDLILNREEILSVIFHEVLILITDVRGIIIYANEKCCETLGYRAEELIGKHTRMFKTGHHSLDFYQNLWETLLSGKAWKGEMATKRKDGSFTWNFMSMYPLQNNDQELYGFLTLRTDITEQKQLQNDLFSKMEKIEYFDVLTDLPNGKSFGECLRKEIDKAKETDTILAVVQMDLDDFKYVNNTFGQSTGNQLLIDFSARIKDAMENKSFCMSRPGGDEFFMVIKDFTELAELSQILSDLYDHLNHKPFAAKGNEIFLSVSMGVSVFPFSGDTVEMLLKNAEIAMHRAKRNGKNQYQIFSPTMDLYNYKQFTLRNDSKKALLREEYCIYYQPRYNPATNEMVSAEALIRWNHPRWGIVSPGEFILMAEETGLIVQIGEWLIRKVCEQIKNWESENYLIKRISINLSALQLLQPNFAETVATILAETGVDSGWIEFEITETVIIQKEQQVLETLTKLKNIGIAIALDDFGTGYSSLNYLRKFPCETIKLDKSLIDEIHEDEDNYEIIASTINLCHKLKKSVVGEGVETAEQLSLLKKLKIDEIQGYFYSKPIEEHLFKKLLKQHKTKRFRKKKKVTKLNSNLLSITDN